MRITRMQWIVFLYALLFCCVAPAMAAVDVRLTLGRAAINFPSADPDSIPSIPANENPVTIAVQVVGNPSGNWQLTVLASGDLVSGADAIAISNVSWTATPLPFTNGTMSKTSPQVVASGSGNVNLTGSVRFFFRNRWEYFAGNYSQQVIYTLSAP